MVDRHEIFADNVEPAFGQQEVDVGDPAVLRILDRDDRRPRPAVLHRLQRVLEAEAGERGEIGARFGRRAVRIGAGRTLEGDRARRIGGSDALHPLDDFEGRAGKGSHGPKRLEPCARAHKSRMGSLRAHLQKAQAYVPRSVLRAPRGVTMERAG